ncbi:MAG TPA: hypothetical protein VMT35_17210 [Ignavibacteriaceae bacterium]|nr:hypothetical protein [Ignavibacteriaceae bacterium]
MILTILVIAAVLIVVYLYFLLNKAVEEPKSTNQFKKEFKKWKKNRWEGDS